MALDRSPHVSEISMREALDITRMLGDLVNRSTCEQNLTPVDFYVTLDSVFTPYSWTVDKPLGAVRTSHTPLASISSSIKWVNNSVV